MSRAMTWWFDRLQNTLIQELMLKLLDHHKPFEVHANTSNFTARRVLMLEGHPITYKIRKKNIVANALNNKVELTSTRVEASKAQVDVTFLTDIQEKMWQYSMVQQLKTNWGEYLEILAAKWSPYHKGQMYIHARIGGDLHREWLKECHDTLSTYHLGRKQTLTLI